MNRNLRPSPEGEGLNAPPRDSDSASNGAMRIQANSGIVALICGLALCVCSAQQVPRPTGTAAEASSKNHARKIDRTLSPDDGLSVIAAALDSRMRVNSELDCSHLVHQIYVRAGFSYSYASSTDLYDGVEGFRRITRPQPGDLIVWRGHAGIVVRPSRHLFFSFMSRGPGVDDYENSYWTGRGRARFYRYIKDAHGHDPCAGCNSVSMAARRPRAEK